MKPKFIGLFPSQFPGWGRDAEPVTHPVQKWDPEKREHVETNERAVCEMAFHPSGGVCLSCRYSPVGVSGIDVNGDCWVLARDNAIPGYGGGVGLRWVRFPVEAAE